MRSDVSTLDAYLLLLLLQRWTVNRQLSFEGGFNGRSNKLVDACYSYWVGALFPLLHYLLDPSGSLSSASASASASSPLRPHTLLANPCRTTRVRIRAVLCCTVLCCAVQAGGRRSARPPAPAGCSSARRSRSTCCSALSDPKAASWTNRESVLLCSRLHSPQCLDEAEAEAEVEAQLSSAQPRRSARSLI